MGPGDRAVTPDETYAQWLRVGRIIAAMPDGWRRTMEFKNWLNFLEDSAMTEAAQRMLERAEDSFKIKLS